jgi:hypothetical protein
MKSKDTELEKLKQTLSSNDIIAEVIKLNARVEDKIDNYLAIQFGGFHRWDDFVELIAPRMTLSSKIDALKKLKLHRKMKSHHNIVEVAERINRVRNKLAHSYQLDNEDLQKRRAETTKQL